MKLANSFLIRARCVAHLTLVLAIVVMASSLSAQTPTGSVSGTVSDSTGALVAGATVRIINNSTHETHSAVTGVSGTYIFPIVPVGEYSLEAESSGFKLDKRTGVTLDVNQNARVDFALQVGTVREVVEVNSDTPMVDTMDVQLGETVDQKRIENLPLLGRNIYDLISLMPGAVGVSNVTTGTNINNSMTVNGNRGSDNNFYIDGGNNTSQFRNGGNMAPNPDAIAEFHLITSNFDAEYGRNPGSVLNVVTRSGANAYHGTVFEFLRNDTVDARSFFQTSTTPLHWNQFGGTFGGPIRHNKTFFFASYQGLREATSTAKTGIIVPTVPERTGNFSALAAAKQPIDPLTGKTFPGGIIPTSRIDPVAQAIMNTMIPLPNSGAGAFTDLEPAPATDDQGMLRIDHQLTSSNRISGTLFLDRSNTSLPFGASANSGLPNWDNASAVYRQNNVIINDTAVISPTLISEARFNYVLNYYATVDSSTTSWPNWGSKLTSGDLPWNPPEFVVTGFWTSGPGGSANDIMPQSTWAGTERVTWIHGKHNIRAGVGYQWNHFMETGNWLGAGQVHFTGAYTGNGLADLELGMAATFRQNNGLDRNFQESSYSAFFQDDWKVLPRLTLDLGVRWELNPPYTSAGNEIAGFEFGVQSKIYPTAPLGMVFPGDPGVPNGVAPTIATNFVLRLGFAWDLFGNGKTAIRGGYGFYYAVGWVNQVSNLQNQPFIVNITINGAENLVDPWASAGVKSPYPYTLSPKNPVFVSPISENYIGDHSGTPYVQYILDGAAADWTHHEPRSWIRGQHRRKLYILRDANSPIYGPTANTTNVNARRPYLPNVFGAIYESETAANSNYNSLQVKFNRRFSHNFSLMANYVWSKSMDLADAEATSISSVTTSDSNDFRRDYGPAVFNYPQVFNMSWVYQSPRVGWFGWLGKEALSGWQLNGIMQARSGHSINVLSGTDSNDDGIAYDRPNVVGSPNITTSQTRAQEIAEFFNPVGIRQSARRCSLRQCRPRRLLGPNAVTWNATATKDFPLPGREGMRLQLRTEFFNLFNQVNFSDPNATLSSTGFGQDHRVCRGQDAAIWVETLLLNLVTKATARMRLRAVEFNCS